MVDLLLDVGSAAPEFTLPDHNEAKVALSDLKGETMKSSLAAVLHRAR